MDYIEEVNSGARGVEITGDSIDRVVIFNNKIRIYILPTGYFEFDIKEEFAGAPDIVSTSID